MTTDLIPAPNHKLVSRRADPLDLAIAAWLDAKHGRSGSTHTHKIYQTTIADFRQQLHTAGLDLDSDPRYRPGCARLGGPRGASAGDVQSPTCGAQLILCVLQEARHAQHR